MSQFFLSGGQSFGASASVLPMNTQGLFPLDWSDLLAVEVTNRFKGLYLVNRMPEEVHKIIQEGEAKIIPQKKKCKTAKWLCEEVLQIPGKRTEVIDKRERERYVQLSAELQRIARRDKKAFLNEQCKKRKKKQRKIIEWERLESSSRKLDIKGICHEKMGTTKDRNGKT